MNYIYKCLEVPATMGRSSGKNKSQQVAMALQELINKSCTDGWEYFRTDQYTIMEPAGCIAGLFGATATPVAYNVLVFRKVEDEPQL
jgi:hypothetical protein